MTVQDRAEARLFGRDPEMTRLGAFVRTIASRGAVLLVSGEAGVGKTALLGAGAVLARGAGVNVIECAGAQFEADVAYSALNQLLGPLLPHLAGLPAEYRAALEVALGLGAGPPPSRLLVGNATLALLVQATTDRPLLVLVDDLHWLDRASAVALAFVARRLSAARIGLLAAVRSDTGAFFDDAGMPTITIGELEEPPARELIATRFPDLSGRVAHQVLRQAQGNPLALVELPRLLSERHATPAARSVDSPGASGRQALFGTRLAQLPPATRQALLQVAFGGAILEGGGPAHDRLTDLEPAEKAGLVHVDDRTNKVTFAHPLVPFALVGISSSLERRQAHRALVEYFSGQPDQQVWHLGAASAEPDEAVAGPLEELAQRRLRRGDALGAVDAMIRAAELSTDPAARASRLAQASYLGAKVTGELSEALSLLKQIGGELTADPTAALTVALAAAFVLLSSQGDIDTGHRILVAAIETHLGGPEPDRASLTEAFFTLALISYFGGRAELWPPYFSALRRMAGPLPEVLVLSSEIFPDPVRTTAPALARLDAAIDRLDDVTDPTEIIRLSTAAWYVDRLPGCRTALASVLEDAMNGGAVASGISAAILLAFDDYLTGEWDPAIAKTDEAIRQGLSQGYRPLLWSAQSVQALIAAARGRFDRSATLVETLQRWAQPRKVHVVDWFCAQAQALAGLGQGDPDLAFRVLSSLSPPGTLPSFAPHVLWTALDLVEAAVHTGRHAEAVAHVRALHEHGVADLSPRLALVTLGASAMTASGAAATDLYEQALAGPGAAAWRFEHARVNLAFGVHLRLGRAVTESRVPLLAARQTFELLGAEPWAARAQAHLEAAGMAVVRSEDPTQLTRQEREVATLAASGLTNKQIAQQLQVTPRTVSAHLYRVFPKLGITRRAALRDALARHPGL